jgi:peptide/nickel transport system permease protein
MCCVYFFAVKLQWVPGISTVFDGMPLPSAWPPSRCPPRCADAGRAGAHDAHDARGDPQRHAVGLYRDGRTQGPLGFRDHLRKHALPNAIAPIINVVMLNLAFLVVGVVVVEVIFVYPGMGQYLVDHVAKRDVPVVQACRPDLRHRLHRPEHDRRHRGVLPIPRLRHPK